jgi:hypothetical protein
MRFRKLRIAWSLGWAAILLFVPPTIQEHLARIPDGVWLWPMFTVCCVMIIGPWLPSRFTTRTLLIATTLLAVVLGMEVYVARLYYLSGILIEGLK